jgi:hypothetical protein
MAACAEDSGTSRMNADAIRLAIRVIFPSQAFVADDHTQICGYLRRRARQRRCAVHIVA